MSDLEELLQDIEKLRYQLNKFATHEFNLIDLEIVSASQKLDDLLNEYQKRVKDKK